MKTLRVPVYASSEVLFPGQLLLLPQAETSLRQMVQFCKETQQPIGVVFISGERGYELARVGTTAHLVKRYEGIFRDPAYRVVVGSSRFQMRQIYQDRDYLEAAVQPWPWQPWPKPEWHLIELVGDYLRRYTQALADLLPPALLPEMLSPDATSLGVLGAALLQLPPLEKQRLLEIRTTRQLLVEVLEHLRLHVPMAERLASMPPQAAKAYERILFN